MPEEKRKFSPPFFIIFIVIIFMTCSIVVVIKNRTDSKIVPSASKESTGYPGAPETTIILRDDYVIIKYTAISGSYEYEISSISYKNESATIHIKNLNSSLIVTDDTAYWTFVVPIKKKINDVELIIE